MSKQTQLIFTQESMTELKKHLGQDGAEAEWARNALKLETLSEKQLQAIEWLSDQARGVPHIRTDGTVRVRP